MVNYNLHKSISLFAFSWLLPLIIALFFLCPVHTIPVSPDGAYYAGQAFNLLEDKVLTYMDGQPVFHRPLFPVILAAAYSLFGKGPIVGYLVVKSFALLNIFLVWLLTRQLFGVGAALTAGLLVTTSYRLNEWSGWLNLDFVLPSFLLIFFIGIFRGINADPISEKHIRWLCAAGFAMGCAVLVKELALLFLPLPVFYGVLFVLLSKSRASISSFVHPAPVPNSESKSSRKFRWHSILRQSGYVYLTFLLTLLPGIIYALWYVGNPTLILGSTYLWASDILLSSFAAGTNESLAIGSLLSRLIVFVKAPAYYFGWQLLAHFIIAPLFIPATIYLLLSAWKGNRSALFLVCSIGLFFPMIILQGIAGFRERQGLIIMYLFIVGLAGLFNALFLLTRQKFPQSRWGLFIAVSPIIFTIILQSSWDMAGNLRLLLLRMNTLSVEHSQLTSLPISAPQPWWSTAVTITAAQQLVQWIDNEELGPDKKFLAFEEDARYLHFLTNGQHQFHTIRATSIESLGSSDQTPVASNSTSQIGEDMILMTLRPPNALLSWRVERNQALPFYQVQFYRQSALIQTITENRIDYIAIGNQDKWLVAYFLLHPDFRKLAEFEYGTIHLFAVLDQAPQAISIPLIIEQEVIDFLTELEEINPTRYEAIVNEVFIQELGFTWESYLSVQEALEHYIVKSDDFGYEALAQWILHTGAWTTSEFEGFVASLPVADSVALTGAVHLAAQHSVSKETLELAATNFQRVLGIDSNHWPTAEMSIRLCSLIGQNEQINSAAKALKHTCSYGTLDSLEREINANSKDGRDDSSLLKRALSIYLTFIEEKPKNTNAYIHLASAYEQLGETAIALSVFEQAVKNDAATAELYLAYSKAAEKILAKDQYKEIIQDGLRIATWDDPAYALLKNKLAKLQ